MQPRSICVHIFVFYVTLLLTTTFSAVHCNGHTLPSTLFGKLAIERQSEDSRVSIGAIARQKGRAIIHPSSSIIQSIGAGAVRSNAVAASNGTISTIQNLGSNGRYAGNLVGVGFTVSLQSVDQYIMIVSQLDIKDRGGRFSQNVNPPDGSATTPFPNSVNRTFSDVGSSSRLAVFQSVKGMEGHARGTYSVTVDRGEDRVLQGRILAFTGKELAIDEEVSGVVKWTGGASGGIDTYLINILDGSQDLFFKLDVSEGDADIQVLSPDFISTWNSLEFKSDYVALNMPVRTGIYTIQVLSTSAALQNKYTLSVSRKIPSLGIPIIAWLLGLAALPTIVLVCAGFIIFMRRRLSENRQPGLIQVVMSQRNLPPRELENIVVVISPEDNDSGVTFCIAQPLGDKQERHPQSATRGRPDARQRTPPNTIVPLPAANSGESSNFQVHVT